MRENYFPFRVVHANFSTLRRHHTKRLREEASKTPGTIHQFIQKWPDSRCARYEALNPFDYYFSLSSISSLNGDGFSLTRFSFSILLILKCFHLLTIKCTQKTVKTDGHSYVNSVASLTNSNGGSSCVQHGQSSSSSGSRRQDQRDYVNQPASGGAHHHHHHHAAPQGREEAAHQKHRRQQKRVTHNEKRYHSGKDLGR